MTNELDNSTKTEIPQLDRAIKEIKATTKRVSDRLKACRKPVDRKVLAMIFSRLLDLEDALSREQSRCATHAEKILATLQLIDDGLKDDAAWDVADYLKELLPLVASADWVYRALLEEKARPADAAWRWTALCDEAKLNKVVEGYDGSLPGSEGKAARQNLAALYTVRNDRGRHDRARERLRAQYLRRVAGGLFVLLVFSVAAMLALGILGAWFPVITVFLAGGLGATLSGTMRIRDVDGIVHLHEAWRTMASQLALGGTLAVIVLFTLQTRLISLGTLDFSGTPDPVVLYLVGLISGYSEPFALGLLKKVIDLGK